MRIVAVLAALIMTLGLALAPAAPAAATHVAGCIHGQSCVWTGHNFTGSRMDLAFSAYWPGCHNFPLHFNNAIQSLVSDYGSGYYLQVYMASNCTGTSWAFPRGALWTVPSSDPLANTFSSFRITASP